jgi:hypothetical protein
MNCWNRLAAIRHGAQGKSASHSEPPDENNRVKAKNRMIYRLAWLAVAAWSAIILHERLLRKKEV